MPIAYNYRFRFWRFALFIIQIEDPSSADSNEKDEIVFNTINDYLLMEKQAKFAYVQELRKSKMNS